MDTTKILISIYQILNCGIENSKWIVPLQYSIFGDHLDCYKLGLKIVVHITATKI